MPNQYTWQVTSQLTDQQTINGAGNVITGVRVYFITGQGNEGVVFVPDTIYNTKSAREMIAANARTLDDVGNLAQS
jgi:hypothetical protein